MEGENEEEKDNEDTFLSTKVKLQKLKIVANFPLVYKLIQFSYDITYDLTNVDLEYRAHLELAKINKNKGKNNGEEALDNTRNSKFDHIPERLLVESSKLNRLYKLDSPSIEEENKDQSTTQDAEKSPFSLDSKLKKKGTKLRKRGSVYFSEDNQLISDEEGGANEVFSPANQSSMEDTAIKAPNHTKPSKERLSKAVPLVNVINNRLKGRKTMIMVDTSMTRELNATENNEMAMSFRKRTCLENFVQVMDLTMPSIILVVPTSLKHKESLSLCAKTSFSMTSRMAQLTLVNYERTDIYSTVIE